VETLQSRLLTFETVVKENHSKLSYNTLSTSIFTFTHKLFDVVISIYNINLHRTITTLQCEPYGRLLSGGLDTRVKVFDLKTNRYLYELIPFGKGTQLETKETIRFESNKIEVIQIIFTVRCLQFDDTKLIGTCYELKEKKSTFIGLTYNFVVVS
jgi:hypothetical protein